MKRLRISIPSRGSPTAACLTSVYEMIQHMGGFVSVHITKRGDSVAAARNELVRYFLDKSECDELLMVDDDVTIPLNTFTELDSVVDGDIVTAKTPIVWRRKKLSSIVSNYGNWRQDKDKKWIEWKPIEHTGIEEVDVCGCGCILIKNKDVFEKLGFPWFYWEEHRDGWVIGEDVGFCRRAREKGFTIIANGNVACDHQKEVSLLEMNRLTKIGDS